jgi:predicted Fe-S protein YdhL (DUF1289 family)
MADGGAQRQLGQGSAGEMVDWERFSDDAQQSILAMQALQQAAQQKINSENQHPQLGKAP